jgi:hypothetical protein
MMECALTFFMCGLWIGPLPKNSSHTPVIGVPPMGKEWKKFGVAFVGLTVFGFEPQLNCTESFGVAPDAPLEMVLTPTGFLLLYQKCSRQPARMAAVDIRSYLADAPDAPVYFCASVSGEHARIRLEPVVALANAFTEHDLPAAEKLID